MAFRPVPSRPLPVFRITKVKLDGSTKFKMVQNNEVTKPCPFGWSEGQKCVVSELETNQGMMQVVEYYTIDRQKFNSAVALSNKILTRGTEKPVKVIQFFAIDFWD